MSVSFWSFVFIALSAQGFFLGFLILKKRKGLFESRLYLGLFILLFSLMLLLWIGFWNGLPEQFPHFNYVYDPLPMLLGPLLFYYVKSQYRSLRKKDIFHLFPFIIITLWYIPFYLLSEEQKTIFMNTPGGNPGIWKGGFITIIMYWVHVLSFVLYSGLLHVYLKRKFSGNVQKLHPKTGKMLRNIKRLFILFTVLYTLNYFIRELETLSHIIECAAGILISIFFYSIGYLGMNVSPVVQHSTPAEKYSRSGLHRSEATNLLHKITAFLESSKPYINEAYKLSDLSLDIGIPSHHISELLNKYHNKNFSELINTYRVEEAKKLLLSETYDNKIISAVGYDVGFNSRTTFHHWFKKVTGKSPAAYRKHKKMYSK